MEALESGNMEWCLKTKVDDKTQPYEGYDSKDQWLQDILWSATGCVEDIPNMKELPEQLQQVLLQYEDIFCAKLPLGKRMKLGPVNIQVDKTMEKPPECLCPHPTSTYWSAESNLLEAGLIEKLDVAEGQLSPSFHLPSQMT